MGKLKNKKIILTGGHAATTALSVTEEIQRRNNNTVSLFWVGPRYAMQGRNIPTLASEILPKKGVEFVPIIAGRFLRKINVWTLVSLIRFPLGFLHAFLIILRIRPDLILSFGGYAGFPVVVVGYLFRVKIVIHDETYSINTANKYSAFFADVICVSRKESLKYYPQYRCVVTGNPILRKISRIKPKIKLSRDINLYITGGSSGSRSINDIVALCLKSLLGNYTITHQTGKLDYERFKDVKESLPYNLKKRYQIHDSVSPFEIHKYFKKADIVLSRAGANTVSEIIITKRPAILIPLIIGPWNEQQKNALYAERFGIAKVVDQEELTAEMLIKSVKNIEKNWQEIVASVVDKQSPDRNADKRLVDELEKVIS